MSENRMPDVDQKILSAIHDEADRIGYGKVLIEVTVRKGTLSNMQVETRRSVELERQ